MADLTSLDDLRENLLALLERREPTFERFRASIGSGLPRLCKRILHLRIPYLKYALAHHGLCPRLVGHGKTFWGKDWDLPLPAVFEFLKRNAPLAHLNNVALSNKSGREVFFSAKEDSAGSTMNSQVADINPEQFNPGEVPTTTLDEYAKNHVQPTFVKLDVEGSEALVLNGGARLIEERHPSFSIEIWPGEMGKRFSEPAADWLKDRGYLPHKISSEGIARPITGEISSQITGTENIIFSRIS